MQSTHYFHHFTKAVKVEPSQSNIQSINYHRELCTMRILNWCVSSGVRSSMSRDCINGYTSVYFPNQAYFLLDILAVDTTVADIPVFLLLLVYVDC